LQGEIFSNLVIFSALTVTRMISEKEYEPEVIIETQPIWKKRRYLVLLLTFLGFINLYTLRINLSVAIVAMTEIRTINHSNGSVTYDQYFNWSTAQQGMVLSSFFYGYICTQFIGGYIASRIGGNVVGCLNGIQ